MLIIRPAHNSGLAKKPLIISNEHCAKHQHSCSKLASVSASSPSRNTVTRNGAVVLLIKFGEGKLLKQKANAPIKFFKIVKG